MRLMVVVACVFLVACSGGSDDVGTDARFEAPALGVDCSCPGGGDCELEACGDRAACTGGTCTIECETSADCPQFAVCTTGANGVHGCFWFCNDAEDCPTTAPTCTGSGFGFCES